MGSQARGPISIHTTINRLAELQVGKVQELEQTQDYPRSWHQWSQPEIDAITLAYAAGRPLLVRGEPGTGKTQMARAAAAWLQWALHAETIHPRFEPHELRYRFDAVRRLADAQSRVRDLDDTRYWRPGVLWKAYGWDSAVPFMPGASEKEKPAGHVVLIDEIDKADSELPNSLLDVLAQRSFRVEPVEGPVGGSDASLPLIVITTNEERDLPAAFLRRCVVLTLAATGDYTDWLIERGRAHFGANPDFPDRMSARLDDRLLVAAAQQLTRDRQEVARLNLAPPGLAEYLDMLYALHALGEQEPDPSKRVELQGAWLERLSAYGYLKHSVEDRASPIHQQRLPLAVSADTETAGKT